MNSKTLAIIIKAEDRASKTVEGVGGTFNAVSSKVIQATKVMAAAGGAAMVALGISAVKSTASIEQSLGGSEVVFGKYADQIQKYAKQSATVMGTSTNQYLETANKMGSLFQGAGFDVKKSMDLTSSAMQRATDVATAMGIDTSMALESIAGAAKGNFTMMDNLGVAMNDTTLEAYRLEKGFDKAVSKMTNAEKVGLAMELFMERTAKYAGNYAKENETLSGSFTTLRATWTNFLSGVEGSGEQVSDALQGMIKVLGRELPVIFDALKRGAIELHNDLRMSSPEYKRYSDMAISAFNIISGAITTTINLFNTFLPVIIGITSGWIAYHAAIITVNSVTTVQNALALATGTRYVMLNGALIAVRTATIGQTIAQTALNTAMKLNPVGALAGLIVGITAAFVAVTSATNNTKYSNDQLNQSLKDGATAAQIAKQALDALTGAELDAEGASLAVKRAKVNLTQAVKDFGEGSLEAKEAAHALERAQLSLKTANERVKAATDDNAKSQTNVKNVHDKAAEAASRSNANSTALFGTLDRLNGRNFSYSITSNQKEVRTFESHGVPYKMSKNFHGGPVRGGEPTIVGENADGTLNRTSELFVPNTAGRIFSSKDLKNALGGGGQGQVNNFNMYGTVNLQSSDAVDRYYERFMGMTDQKQALSEYGVGG